MVGGVNVEMAGRLLSAVLLVSAAGARATETDSFTGRYTELPDVMPALDAQANLLLRVALDEANSRARTAAQTCNERLLYRAIFRQLGGSLVGRFETFVNDAAVDWGLRPARKDSVYREFGWFEAPSLGSLEEGRLATIVSMGGHRIGADKFGHFFSEGYTSFEQAFIDGEGVDAALEYGDLTERTYFGALVTGVYSYADLAANFNGIRFWVHLLGRYPDPLGGAVQPLVGCEEDSWKLLRAFSWADYVDAAWDEGVNCSLLRNEGMREKLVAAVADLQRDSGHPYACPLGRGDEPAMRAKYGRFFGALVNLDGFGVIGSFLTPVSQGR